MNNQQKSANSGDSLRSQKTTNKKKGQGNALTLHWRNGAWQVPMNMIESLNFLVPEEMMSLGLNLRIVQRPSATRADVSLVETIPTKGQISFSDLKNLGAAKRVLNDNDFKSEEEINAETGEAETVSLITHRPESEWNNISTSTKGQIKTVIRSTEKILDNVNRVMDNYSQNEHSVNVADCLLVQAKDTLDKIKEDLDGGLFYEQGAIPRSGPDKFGPNKNILSRIKDNPISIGAGDSLRPVLFPKTLGSYPSLTYDEIKEKALIGRLGPIVSNTLPLLRLAIAAMPAIKEEDRDKFKISMIPPDFGSILKLSHKKSFPSINMGKENLRLGLSLTKLQRRLCFIAHDSYDSLLIIESIYENFEGFPQGKGRSEMSSWYESLSVKMKEDVDAEYKAFATEEGVRMLNSLKLKDIGPYYQYQSASFVKRMDNFHKRVEKVRAYFGDPKFVKDILPDLYGKNDEVFGIFSKTREFRLLTRERKSKATRIFSGLAVNSKNMVKAVTMYQGMAEERDDFSQRVVDKVKSHLSRYNSRALQARAIEVIHATVRRYYVEGGTGNVPSMSESSDDDDSNDKEVVLKIDF